MLFNTSHVTLTHAGSGVVLDFTALEGLKGWHEEALPPLQVKVAQVRDELLACACIYAHTHMHSRTHALLYPPP